jgi:hypothetical protein
MRAMTERQYNIVKIFVEGLKVDPRKLVKKWAKCGVIVELHEVFRVMLTVNYEVYKKDETPDEDVIMAMLGTK